MSSNQINNDDADSYPLSTRIKEFEQKWYDMTGSTDKTPLPWYAKVWIQTCACAALTLPFMAWRQVPWYTQISFTALCALTIILAYFASFKQTSAEDTPESGSDSEGSGEA